MRLFVPPHQFAAFLAGVGLGLLFNPSLCSNLRNLPEVFYNILVMTYAIDDMHLAEVFYPLTGKFCAFIATGHSMFLCTASEAHRTCYTVSPQFIRKAAVTFIRITGACAAEKAAYSSTFFIRNSHNTTSLSVF